MSSSELWDSVTKEEWILGMISSLYHPFFQPTIQLTFKEKQLPYLVREIDNMQITNHKTM